MSRYNYGPHHGRPQIVVNDNDVLSGRGVNIAHHCGNQRFRTLVTTRADESYCATYSASEKRAVAEEVIKHVKSLDPPGRFLKRDGRGQVSRGLSGPWEELSEREAIKKTCQALRDCNRLDRQGYAAGVNVPSDVQESARQRQSSGLTGKQQAARAAAEFAAAQAAATIPSHKRDWGRVSPSVENAAEWLKKQRTDEMSAGNPTAPAPSTAGTDAMHGGTAPIPYDPAAVGMPPYEPIHPPSQYPSAPAPAYPQAPAPAYPQGHGPGYPPAPAPAYPPAQAPAPTYQQRSASPSTYAPVAPAPPAFNPAPGPPGYGLTPASAFAPAPGQGHFHSAPGGHAPATSIGYNNGAPAPVNVIQPSRAPAPYAQTAGQAAAAASTPDPGQPWSPVYAHPHPGAPLAMPGQNYAPVPPPQGYAPIPAPGPYAPAPPGQGGTNGNVHYQQQTAPSYQHAPPGYHQHQQSQSSNGGYHHAPAPIAYTAVSPSPTTYQASNNPSQGSYQHAPAPAPITYHHQPGDSTPAPSYQPAPTVEADLSPAPAPIAPAGSESIYTPPPHGSSTHSFPPPLPDSAYEQGDILAPSAGADLLISAAYQSEPPSASEAQALVDAAVVAAAKWEGETLGL